MWFNPQEIVIAKGSCTFSCMSPCIIRMRDQFPFTSFQYTSSNDLSENLLDIVGGRKHLSFWHGINNLESMCIPDERWHQFRSLNHALLLIGDLISHLHLAARLSHDLICREAEP
jgi:hypothetical protein